MKIFITPDMFINSFIALQRDAAETNRKNRFDSPEGLIDEFEQFLEDQRAYFGGNGPDSVYIKYRPLLDMFRHARIGLKLALIMGELGETLEAVRKSKEVDDHCPEFSAETVELADAIIRIMNLAHDRNLPLAEAIVAKNRYNRNRRDHQPAARAAANGKKF